MKESQFKDPDKERDIKSIKEPKLGNKNEVVKVTESQEVSEMAFVDMGTKSGKNELESLDYGIQRRAVSEEEQALEKISPILSKRTIWIASIASILLTFTAGKLIGFFYSLILESSSYIGFGVSFLIGGTISVLCVWQGHRNALLKRYTWQISITSSIVLGILLSIKSILVSFPTESAFLIAARVCQLGIFTFKYAFASFICLRFLQIFRQVNRCPIEIACFFESFTISFCIGGIIYYLIHPTYLHNFLKGGLFFSLICTLVCVATALFDRKLGVYPMAKKYWMLVPITMGTVLFAIFTKFVMVQYLLLMKSIDNLYILLLCTFGFAFLGAIFAKIKLKSERQYDHQEEIGLPDKSN